MSDVEQTANELIQKGVKVYPTLYESTDHLDLLKVNIIHVCVHACTHTHTHTKRERDYRY